MARRLTAELVATLTDKVSPNARRVGHALDQMDRRAQRSTRAGDRLGASSGRLGGAMGLLAAQAGGIAAPVAAAFGARSVITAAADFETALTNIQKKSGATAEQTVKLGEDIKALATSGEVAVPIEEIAAAYERGAAAGIPLDELRQFALLSAKASDAFEMSATDVGNAAAGFNKVLGVPMQGMERYFDLINSLADAGIADESDIVQFIDQAGAMGKTFGLSAEETAAFGAALANLKVPAAKGATAMNSIFTRLLAPDALSSDAREAYYQLIKDDKKFKKQLESGEADKAFVDVIDALAAMDKETRTGVIVELFGQDHLDVMTQLVEGSEELKRNLATAGGSDWFGSLDQSYALKLNDFWSRWQLFKNNVEKAAIDVGTFGLPHLVAGMTEAQALIGRIRAEIANMEFAIDTGQVTGAKTAVEELVTGIGNLLNIDTSTNHLTAFFRDVASVVNDISAGVNATRGFIGWMDERANDVKRAIGMDPDAPDTRDRSKDRTLGPNGAITIEDGGLLGTYLDHAERTIGMMTGNDPGPVNPAPPAPARHPDDPYVYNPAIGFRVGPFTGNDPEAQARAEERWKAIQAEHAVENARANMPARPITPTPQPSHQFGPPMPANLAPNGFSDLRAEIAEIDALMSELYTTEQDAKASFRLAPDPSAITTLRAIGDEMERLVAQREALAVRLEAAESATAIAPGAAPAPGIPIPTARPDIAAPVEAEVQRAAEAARTGGLAIQTALSVHASPTVDTSGIDRLISRARTARSELDQLQVASNRAFQNSRMARLDTSAAMADLSRAG